MKSEVNPTTMNVFTKFEVNPITDLSKNGIK